MAKKPNDGPAAKDHNGIEKRWVGEIERHLSELDSMRGEYMAACKDVRERIAECYDRAKDAGLPKKALKAVIKTRQLQKKIEGLREDLAEDGLDESYDQIRHALGDLSDLPLGQAALKDKAPNPVDSLATADEFDAIGADNAAKIEAGIKPLPN